jgi:hypothetical protein
MCLCLCAQDLAVVAAVEQLQSAKQELARLEGLREAFCADSKQSQLQQLVTAVQEGRHAPASLAT